MITFGVSLRLLFCLVDDAKLRRFLAVRSLFCDILLRMSLLPNKCFSLEIVFIFPYLELMFSVFELVFNVLELMFSALEQHL